MKLQNLHSVGFRLGKATATVVLWLAAFSALPFDQGALAAEPVAEAQEGHAHGADAAHELPGPVTANKNDVDLALWSLITFVVFVFVLKKLAWGPLIEGLNKREAGVIQNISDAETARVKAEKMLAEHQLKLDKVQDEVREILAEARRDAEYTKNDIIAVAQREAEATRTRAVQDIERARDQALDDLFSHMTRAVEEATEHVLGRGLTDHDHDRLIEEALTSVTRK